jgi:diguanylate cyclase (GGDEF)-like protein/PAS domain S-box-containing protein
MGTLSIRENRNLLEANRRVLHTHEVLETSSSLRAHLSDAGIARRLFLQGSKDQAIVFRTASRASLTDFSALRNLTVDNTDQQKRLDGLEPIVEARLALLDQSITAHSEARHDEALQRNLTDQSTRLMQQFVERLRQFDNAERELLQRRSQSAAEGVQRTSRIDIGLILSVFCVIFMAAIALNRELLRRKQAEREIASQKSLLQSVLDTCTDPVVVADSSAKIILRNPAAKRSYGDALDRVSEDVPRVLGFYRSDETTLFSYQDLPLWRAINGERVDNLEMCVRPDGEGNSRWVLASSGPLLDLNAKSHGGVVFYRDVTDRKALESKLANYAQKLECANLELQMAKTGLERVALIDELTGLHNRRGFLTLADQSLKLVARSEKPFVLIFVDLDGLKEINDKLGHNEGDRAIRDAAMVLKDGFRYSDVLSRLGGDEFAILMVDADASSASIVKQRLLAKVAKLNAEKQRPYLLSLSLGMLVCDWKETSPVEALLEKADALMYEDKEKRKMTRVYGHQVHT